MFSAVPKLLFDPRYEHCALVVAPTQEPGKISKCEGLNGSADLLHLITSEFLELRVKGPGAERDLGQFCQKFDC